MSSATRLQEPIRSADLSVRAFSGALGSRLRAAVETAGPLREDSRAGSIRGLSLVLDEREVTGHSRQMIRSYLQGETQPSLEFIRAAANVLNVRPAWLAFGEGPMRPEEIGEPPPSLDTSGHFKMIANPSVTSGQVLFHSWEEALEFVADTLGFSSSSP